jgi:fumarate reductase subunit D
LFLFFSLLSNAFTLLTSNFGLIGCYNHLHPHQNQQLENNLLQPLKKAITLLVRDFSNVFACFHAVHFWHHNIHYDKINFFFALAIALLPLAAVKI